MAIKIIYLLGLGHSGTTLLGRLLNAHSRVIATGGTKNIPLFVQGRKSCTCGAGSPEECSFWCAVNRSLEMRGHSLGDLAFGYDNQNNLDNAQLQRYFESVVEAGNVDAIVDTSRRRTYFSKLESVPGVELIPVHLFKDPRAQYSSNKRKGTGLLRSVWNYNLRSRRVRGMAPADSPVIHVSYESLCADPSAQLQRIMTVAGLEVEDQQINAYGEQETHILGGNRQRKDKSSVIRLDESWRERLKPSEKSWVRFLAGATHKENLRAAGESLE